MLSDSNKAVQVHSNKYLAKCCDCHKDEQPTYVEVECYWCGVKVNDWHECPKFILDYVKFRLGLPQQPAISDDYWYDD